MKKFKKKIYLGLVVGVSMFGFMAHTKQVTADTNQKERIMSQLDDSQIEYVPNELIVSLKATQRISTEKNKPQNLLGVKVMVEKDLTLRTNESDYNKRDQVLLVKLNEEISVEEAVRTFNASDMVNYAEPNYVVELEPLNDVEEPNTTDSLGNRSIILNDPNWSKQANLREISMPSAWEETKGSKDVKVAVIDSGIDYQHEDLSGNVDESLRYDFFDDDTDPMDTMGHGHILPGLLVLKQTTNYHLKETGTMAIVLPHGVLFRGAAEGVIRQKLLEDGSIHAVIGMPANLFFGTSIPTTVIVLKKNRQTRDVLFIDASREFVKGKNQNKLSEENIQKILETYAERKDVEKYAHLATFDEIKENDYNLNIPRYVDTFEEEEPIDMVHVGNDIKKIRQEQQVLEKELLEAISSLQTTPENEAWLQGALEVFKHEQ
ncbi:peptidase [Enterococcus faecium]|nr:peptidase [Enterococcus faecium]